MTTTTLGWYIGMSGALLLGFVIAAAIGFPLVRAHALAESAEQIRVLTNPILVQPERTDWPVPLSPRTSDTVTDLPRQWGTLHEHKRRPMGWGEVTDHGLVSERSIEPGRHRARRQFRIGRGLFAALSAPRRWPLANPDWRTDVQQIPARELVEVAR
jgi:hypothetical protein